MQDGMEPQLEIFIGAKGDYLFDRCPFFIEFLLTVIDLSKGYSCR
jgi:hypothetical protein